MDELYIERQFNRLNDQLLKFTEQMGSVVSILEREKEDRQSVSAALGQFRDDITELMALGPITRTNQATIADHTSKIDAIEKWRNRFIGFRMAYHSMAGAVGGGFVFVGDFLYRMFSAHHGNPN